jgi:hypothetical protein
LAAFGAFSCNHPGLGSTYRVKYDGTTQSEIKVKTGVIAMSSEEMRTELEVFVNEGLRAGWQGWPVKAERSGQERLCERTGRREATIVRAEDAGCRHLSSVLCPRLAVSLRLN